MRRAQLLELLHEVHRVTGLRSVIVIGSQCIHAITDSPPPEVLLSVECDVLVADDDLRARLEGELGKASEYLAERGVYVDAVSPSFPFLPDGWESRATTLQAGAIEARCLEIDDLVISKLAAGRIKDNETVAALFDAKLAHVDVVRARITAIPDPHGRASMLARLQLVLESMG